jgi:hypothetical protein
MVIYLVLIDTSHKSRDGKKHKPRKAEIERNINSEKHKNRDQKKASKQRWK